jgi:hypothetical protein
VKSEFGSRFIAGLGKVLLDEELADGRQLDRLRASFDKCSDLNEDVRAAVAGGSAMKLVGATRATMPSRSGSWTCGSSTSSTAAQRRERANVSPQRPLPSAGV